MDTKMGRARIFGRVAALGTATVVPLLATGIVGSAGAAQAATVTAAQLTAHGVSESFTLPAGVDAVKLGAGSAHVTVTRPAGVSPNNAIPCNLSVTNPAYSSGSVQSTATIRCAYPTTVYLQIGLTYNGSTSVYNGQNFPANYVASISVSTTATPGYYQSNAIGILGDGEQYGYVYSSNVYIPQ